MEGCMMKSIQVNQGEWLDIGVGVFALSLLAGAAVLILGRSLDRVHSHRQESKGPAEPGTIPPERHQNIKTVAAR
jgi:hypothetical protein